MKQTQSKLDGISIIRTFATIGIMLYHIGYGHFYLTQLDLSSGVYLFFCISSFLVMYTTEAKTAGCFLKRRLIRIVPLYFLLTILTFVASKYIGGFGQGDITFAELSKSLLFIPYSRSGLKSDFAVRPIVGPAWTLYYDVWFAFVFFFSMKISHKNRGVVASVICIALCCLGKILPDKHPLGMLLRTGFLLSFVAGVIVYYVWTMVLRYKTTAYPLLWGTVTVLLVWYFYFVSRGVFSKTMISSAILIGILVSTYGRSVPRIFTLFSNLSFSFYLLHYYVIFIVGRFFDFSKLNIQTIIGTVLAVALTIPLSFCSYVMIEKKLSDALNQ